MEKYVDICVVGGSGSGMAAAITAKQQGASSVMLLEKMKNVGGCTVMSAGMFGVDTPAQHRQGLYYSPDDMYRDLMQIFNWNVDAMLVRKWINGSGENFRWLEDLGLKYDICVTETADISKFRNTMHRIADFDGEKWNMKPHGPFITKCLKNACRDLGVEIITEARANSLIQDENGSVIGLTAETADGELTVHAKAVILCTGSISSNKDLIRRFYASSEYDDVRIMAQVPHNTGDGLIMAEAIGAAAGKISTLLIGPQNHFAGGSEVTGMLMRRPHGIKVSMNGERFVDESLPVESEYGWMCSVALDNLPGKRCWAIMDQSLMDIVMLGEEYIPYTPIRSLLDQPMAVVGEYKDEGYTPEKWREHILAHFKYEQANGRAAICQTVEEMAAFIGCEADVLRCTLDRYNLFCAKGYDEDFLKDKNYLYPLSKAPYYVMLGLTGIDTCLGGLKIDNHQRVVRPDGTHIPGLYAAGVLTSGWVAGLYAVNGSEMSYTIFSGRNAAEEAVGFIA